MASQHTPQLVLRTVLGNHGQTAALKDGTVTVPGAKLEFIEIKPMIEAYRRMARQAEFDVCELAPTTYLAAKSLGAPFTALPIPMTRRFRHAGMLRRQDSSIRHPKDLEGRRIGVRAYTVTAGVWTRGIFINEYGLDSSKVTWLVDDEEHVTALKLPPNVVHVPPGETLARLMAAGEIEAGFAGAAGVGEPPEGQVYVDLFEKPAELEAAWYQKTHIYPIHGLIVVRDELLKAHPWLARALLEAFTQAKARYLQQVMSGAADQAEDRRYRKLAGVVGDPLPYGMKANLPSLEALVLYAKQQGFLPADLTVPQLILDPEG